MDNKIVDLSKIRDERDNVSDAFDYLRASLFASLACMVREMGEDSDSISFSVNDDEYSFVMSVVRGPLDLDSHDQLIQSSDMAIQKARDI